MAGTVSATFETRKSNLPMKIFLLCSALAALALPAANAQARPLNSDPDFPHVSVSYAGLDLNRPAGADLMIARVRRAAHLVCSDGLFVERTEVRRINECVRVAMTGAFAQLDAPLVRARYLERTPNAELAASR